MSGKNQMSVFMDKINTVSYSGLLSGFWVVGLWVAIHWTTLEFDAVHFVKMGNLKWLLV